MKQILYYRTPDSTRKGKGINLCTEVPTRRAPFYILPGEQMSYVKIISLPPVPKKKLYDMVRFQVQTIYPGTSTESCFDYIPYKGRKEWQIVLYFLKKNSITDICRDRKCRGIVLPLQLAPKKALRAVSSLVVVYPDMAEVWELKRGTPRNVKRFTREEFQHSDAPYSGKRIIISQGSEKSVTAFLKKGDIHITFRETVRSISFKRKYFPEFKREKRDGLTPVLSITAFSLSLFLLVHMLTDFTNIQKKVNGNDDAVKSRQQQIDTLEKTLRERDKHKPVNVYTVLYLLRKTIDHHTTIASFTFSGQEISLSCSSKHALETVKRIKNEFSTVHISGITPSSDGTEHYTVKLEIKR